jgi:AcrR family transcriptional regulator
MSSASKSILKAAIELFSEKGFKKTSVREICAKANVNVAAVNYHFKSKLGVGRAVINYLFEDYEERQEMLFPSDPIETAEEWEKRIKDFIYHFILLREKKDQKSYYRSKLIFSELDAPSELYDELYRVYLEPFQRKLIEYIKMGLPPEAPESKVTLWFMTIISQCIMFRKKNFDNTALPALDFSENENVRMFADHIAGTVLHSLKYRKKESK